MDARLNGIQVSELAKVLTRICVVCTCCIDLVGKGSEIHFLLSSLSDNDLPLAFVQVDSLVNACAAILAARVQVVLPVGAEKN